MTILAVSPLKIDIRTFKSFIKFRGAEPKPKYRQINSNKLPDHRRCIAFVES